MGDVDLNGSVTTGLEVYEQRARLRVEQVPGMWLAVQQLLVGAAAGNGGRQTLQRLAEKFPVRVNKPWGLDAVTEQRLCLRDSISEMRRRPLDLLHAGMQPHERLRILRWGDWGRQGLVLGPKGDDAAVTPLDP